MKSPFRLAVVIPALLLTLVLMALSCTSAPTSTSTSTTTPQYTINVSTSPTLGQYLVDSKGMALYWTTADARGVSNVPDNLLSVWPVFYVSNIVVPSSLNASDFGSITRTNGSPQTTFKGWPLYYYASDTAPGQTGGQGVGGRWSVVNPGASGPQPVPTSTTSTTPTTTSTSATTTTTTTTTMVMPTTTTTTTTTSTTAPTSTTTSTTTSTSPSAKSVTIDLVAENIAFNMSTITVPAGAAVTINFDNKDSQIPHNFALYQSGNGPSGTATAPIFTGQIIVGPSTTVYNFTAPTTPGNYFFRCDVHPTIMYGTFVVTSS